MPKEKLLKPTPVRLHQSAKPRLDVVAKRFRMSEAAIIRIAVDQKLEEWMSSGELRVRAS